MRHCVAIWTEANSIEVVTFQAKQMWLTTDYWPKSCHFPSLIFFVVSYLETNFSQTVCIGGENCPNIALTYKLFSRKPNYLVIQLIAPLSAERPVSPFMMTLFKVTLMAATSNPVSEEPPATAPRMELRCVHNLLAWQERDAEVPLLKIHKC